MLPHWIRSTRRPGAATWFRGPSTTPRLSQDLHNQGKRIVLIFDEASAIADKVWEVAEGALTDENTRNHLAGVW